MNMMKEQVIDYRIVPGVDERPELPEIPKTAVELIEQAANKYGVTVEEIKSRVKSGFVVEARQYAMYLIFTQKKLSKTAIGLMFLRNHATVIHALKVIPFRIEHNQLLVN